MKKIKHILFLLIIGCSNSQVIEEFQLINEFEEIEKFRVWKTEKKFNKQDSMYSERRYFTAYDSLNRVINKNNSIFYSYDSSNKILQEKTIYRRDKIVKIITKEYEYNVNGNLEMILRIGETPDTIQKFKYDDENRIIESNTGYKKITYKYDDVKIIKKVSKRGNANPRISNFVYDSLRRPIIENWVYSDNRRMKTTFKYDDRNRLIAEIDSTCSKAKDPNTFIEFMTEYKYNSKDSIVEEIKSGRIFVERDFKFRGKTTFEYEKKSP